MNRKMLISWTLACLGQKTGTEALRIVGDQMHCDLGLPFPLLLQDSFALGQHMQRL